MGKKEKKACHSIFESNTKKYVEAENLVFCLTVRDGQLYFSGDSKFLDSIEEKNLSDVTLKDMCSMMLSLGPTQSTESRKFSVRRPLIFAPLPTKINSKRWTSHLAQDVLKNYMQIQGYVRTLVKFMDKHHTDPSGGQTILAGKIFVTLHMPAKQMQHFLLKYY